MSSGRTAELSARDEPILEQAVLSEGQVTTLAAVGEERTAAVGDVLFRAGDRTYPFIAVLEGEALVRDAADEPIARYGARGFLGEMDLLSGQTVFVTAVVTAPMRYLAVEREQLRSLLFEDEALSELLLSKFMARREALQRASGAGIEVFGRRDSPDTRRILDFARRLRLPFTWRDPEHGDVEAATALAGLAPAEIPLIRVPGGRELRGPSNGQLSRALGIGLELRPREEVDLLIIGAGPAGLAAAVYGASEGLKTLVVERTGLGGQASYSRRIENLLGFPAGISGSELASRAVTQARKFDARTATPYRALSLEPGGDRHLVRLEDDRPVTAHTVLIATGADYRRLPVAGLAAYEGLSVLYEAGPPEAARVAGQRVGVVGGGNSAAQAAVWLARGGALVTLLHRRAQLRETMSHYLIEALDRAGVVVRDRSEIAALHGADGELEAVTLEDGQRMAMTSLFSFLGAVPCTGWLDGTVARDADGFILTGVAAGAGSALETSVPGVFAAGDVRAGSSKRCATAIGEGGAMVAAAHERVAHLVI